MFELIDIKSVLPLVGVIVGWLLTELSYIWRSQREEKKAIGKSIQKMFELRSYLEQCQQITYMFLIESHVGDSMNFAKNTLSKGDKIERDLDSLQQELAGFDPILSYMFGKKIKGSFEVAKASLDVLLHPTPNEMFNEVTKKTQEFALGELQKDITEMILKFSLRKSWLMWVRAKRHLKENPIEYKQFPEHAKEIHTMFPMPAKQSNK